MPKLWKKTLRKKTLRKKTLPKVRKKTISPLQTWKVARWPGWMKMGARIRCKDLDHPMWGRRAEAYVVSFYSVGYSGGVVHLNGKVDDEEGVRKYQHFSLEYEKGHHLEWEYVRKNVPSYKDYPPKTRFERIVSGRFMET